MIVRETGTERWQVVGDLGEEHTRLSPLSLVMFAGRPAGSACSKIGTSPCLAASYIRVANAMTSGESGVGWIVWSPMASTGHSPVTRRMICTGRSWKSRGKGATSSGGMKTLAQDSA